MYLPPQARGRHTIPFEETVEGGENVTGRSSSSKPACSRPKEIKTAENQCHFSARDAMYGICKTQSEVWRLYHRESNVLLPAMLNPDSNPSPVLHR